MEKGSYIDEFSGLARNFCNFSEQSSSAPNEECIVLRLVANLYASAFCLDKKSSKEYIGPNISEDISDAVYKRYGRLEFIYYRSIDDPEKIPGEEPSVGDLADDLRDIYVDLKSGLICYDAGDEEQAEEEWKVSFYLHWGQHAASVINVLNSYGAPSE